MLILFQSEYSNSKEVDPVYAEEFKAAHKCGFECGLLQQEAIDEGRYKKAVTGIPQREGMRSAIYRGWMLREEEYRRLFHALASRGVELITSPEAYVHTHHFPEAYAAIEPHTPDSLWMSSQQAVSDAGLEQVADFFGDGPLVIKDYVKSQKHKWDEACFVPMASDLEKVGRVVQRFIELQDDMLVGGIVFRKFLELEQLGSHSKSGMPLTKEFRQFVFDGKPMLSVEYWEEGDYQGLEAPGNEFAEVLSKVRSRFFTIDIAKQRDGNWVIIELGDGQVAGLPDRLSRDKFYQALAAQIFH